MNEATTEPGGYRQVHHRTLQALCEQLRRLAPRVVAPVHLFDIPPQVMRGLFSVALVTAEGELHRCVVPYRDAGLLAAGRSLLANLLLWGELTQVEGRMEIGANTGNLLRYFLPNAGERDDLARRHQERSHADWQAAAERVAGPRQIWKVGTEDGGAVGGITVAGAHYLLRLRGAGEQRLEAARSRLGCRIIGTVPTGGHLARDVLGEWLA